MDRINNFYDLEELSESELQKIEGGWLVVVAAISAALVGAIVNDWENFKAGLAGKPPVQ